MLRCLPEDRTNGFFVSCFVRDSSGPHARKRKISESEVVDPEQDENGLDGKSNRDLVKPKTAAQLERARRKKTSQKKRRKRDIRAG